jgi:Trypsin-co-occurring domain 1
MPVRVALAGPGAADGMSSVGLRDLDLNGALETVGEISSTVVDKLKAARPTKATVEMKFGFEIEAGKLTALWVGAKGDASLTVTLEWSGHHGAPAGGDG